MVKRKVIALVVITFLLIVAGCTSREYESNMELGKEQVQEQNYLEAYEAFAFAYKENETTEARELKELTKLVADGISQYKQKKYEDALSSFKKAAGYDAKTKTGKQLVTKADEWVTKIDNTQHNSSTAEEGQVGTDDPVTQEEGQVGTDDPTIQEEGQVGTDNPATQEDGNMDVSEGNPGQTQKPSDSGNSGDSNEGTSKLTVKEAEQLVKDFIKIENYPQLSVQYDHNDEKGDYVFQVFESVEDGQGGHTATWGWYGVNLKTKEVYDIMK